MKRHQVMDLFYAKITEEDGCWHKVEDGLPDCKSTKVKVRLSNGDETYAYYYDDKAIKFEKYRITPCHFWHASSHDALLNVTDWKKLKEKTGTEEKLC